MSSNVSQKIIAVFDSFAWADEAAKLLKLWDKAESGVKFQTISLVYKADDGQLKTRNHGARNTLMGLRVGIILGLLAGRMVRSMALGMLAGAAVGALAGSLSLQPPDLSPEELEGLLADLKEGKAGLVIPFEGSRADQVANEIKKLNGEVKKYYLEARNTRPVSEVATAGAV